MKKYILVSEDGRVIFTDDDWLACFRQQRREIKSGISCKLYRLAQR